MIERGTKERMIEGRDEETRERAGGKRQERKIKTHPSKNF